MSDFEQKRDIEIDMLRGNINRMCVADDCEELDDMTLWAIKRICTLRDLNKKRLEVTE